MLFRSLAEQEALGDLPHATALALSLPTLLGLLGLLATQNSVPPDCALPRLSPPQGEAPTDVRSEGLTTLVPSGSHDGRGRSRVTVRQSFPGGAHGATPVESPSRSGPCEGLRGSAEKSHQVPRHHGLGAARPARQLPRAIQKPHADGAGIQGRSVVQHDVVGVLGL